ncbi:phage tail terminator family protein [Clostridium saccharobutylicum]|uniref:Phage protein n=1 Tax=Clostridium saccharobutylicum DSM 13864 TaxID=1345695 RepID=U5MTQ4_CLOSA|nr:hypothetical protein [Clostridium saccharobutylicum]AGX43955.1 hypothetical protein CLSA_c29880 [Clostridium saccharobutylicum DSM 13864]AQR91252.1 hypothetical protein CLOSC_29760 [Clostridium saccharobutylicum]AQS01156.1 hypothetical protein CSACC_29830 [Clostridium saccharobutylicum]AQS10569.1 hypothetical protein CLOBY_27140 [Clostridium saccharobutylicum]AQS15139.1 hypothetical protein CLOSACC_29830 [Clostridium saccharobutylicum]
MKLSDIQKSITKLLKSNFPDYKIVVDNNNKKDIEKPTFFVQVRPVKSYNYKVYKERLVNVTITYVNATIKHEENLDISDSLEGIFNLTLDVLDRHLLISNLTFNETNDLLNCSFGLDFNDDSRTYIVIEDEDKDLMGELIFKI